MSAPELRPAEPPAEMLRDAVERLQAERARLADVIVRLPAVLEGSDADELVAGIGQLCIDLTGARFALYQSVEADARPRLVGVEWHDFAEPPHLAHAPLLAGPIVHGQSHRIDDVAAWVTTDDAARGYGALAGGRLVRSWISAPIARRGATVGVLCLGHHRPHAFTADDEALVAGLAAHLGLAIDRAAATVERDGVVAALEQTLLPPVLPKVEGVDLAARYRAAGRASVGGDFYDVFPVGDGRWAVVLGDVSGSGVDAAALTGVARSSLRVIAPDERSPARALRRLNGALLRQGIDERFCTVVLAYIEPDGAETRITLCNAGHPRAAVVRDDESVVVLGERCGTLLGAFEDVTLDDARTDLGPGDALVLYTDGIVAARDASGEELGEARIVELLSACAGRTAEGIARRVELAAITHAAGAGPLDDSAVVVIRSRYPAS